MAAAQIPAAAAGPSAEAQQALLDALGVLASGVTGRGIRVALQSGREVPTWTDGSTIHLDRIALSDSADARLKVLVQAGLLAAGSLAADCLKELRFQRRIASRYLYLEVLRAVGAVQARLPRLLLVHPAVASGSLTHSPQDSLRLARSKHPLPEPPLLFGSIRPNAALRNREFRDEQDSEQAAQLAAQARQSSRIIEVDELDPDEDSEEIALFKYLSLPFMRGGPLADILKDILGMGSQSRGKTEDTGGGGDLPTGRQELGRKRSRTALAFAVSSIPDKLQEAPRPAGIQYPEWDVEHRRYRPDWVTVLEAEPWNPQPEATPDWQDSVYRPALRRQLTGIGLNHEQHRRQPLGDEIEVDALLQMAVDLRCGQDHAPDIYRKPLKTRRDLGVLLLVDTSSSTCEAGGQTDGRGSRIHDQQIEAVLAFSQELHRLGDRTAVYAFQSWGRHYVSLLRLKSFDEHSYGVVRERAAHLVPEGYTRIGGAIRHAAAVLDAHAGTPYKVLLVISDGYCYDHDYEGRQAEGDTAQALRELRSRNIAPLCISIGSAIGDSTLKRVFGEQAHVSGDHFAAVIPQLRRLLLTSIRNTHRRTRREPTSKTPPS